MFWGDDYPFTTYFDVHSATTKLPNKRGSVPVVTGVFLAPQDLGHVGRR
jgi:hypothetical protein